MSSPFQKKFSAKSPLNPSSPFRQEQEFVETRFKEVDGQRIPTRREVIIPGEERLTFEQVGVDPREGKKYWQENPEKYQEYLESKAPRKMVQERDVNVNLRKTPSSFTPGKKWFGVNLSQDIGETMPMENIIGIVKKAREINKGNEFIQDAIDKEFEFYLKEAGYKRKPGKIKKSINTTEWRDIKSGN